MSRRWVIVCLFTATLTSQSITSRMVGTVSDSSGAGVAGAAIVARNVDTNERIESRSGAGGDYLLLNLKPGGYEVEVNAPGFKKYVRKGVRLQLEQEWRLDVPLELGQVSEAVTVDANVTTL